MENEELSTEILLWFTQRTEEAKHRAAENPPPPYSTEYAMEKIRFIADTMTGGAWSRRKVLKALDDVYEAIKDGRATSIVFYLYTLVNAEKIAEEQGRDPISAKEFSDLGTGLLYLLICESANVPEESEGPDAIYAGYVAAGKAIRKFWPLSDADRKAENAEQKREARQKLKDLDGTDGKDPEETMPVLRAARPELYLIANSLINNSMTSGLVNAGNIALDPSRRGKGAYHVYATITLDPESYRLSKPFTSYDRRVFNGYCSLAAAGNTAFTAEMVFRAMNGLTGSENVSPQQIAAVTRSLEKQKDINVEIDATEEFRKRKIIGQKDTRYFGGRMLAVRLEYGIVGGQVKRVYHLTEEPILYEYARLLGQIISVPTKMLAVKDESSGRVSSTDSFSEVREYLLHRIGEQKSLSKRGGGRELTINIQTFYSEIGVDTSRTKNTNKARKQAAQCLDYWKSEKYISEYKFVQKNPDGRTSPITKIKIWL